MIWTMLALAPPPHCHHVDVVLFKGCHGSDMAFFKSLLIPIFYMFDSTKSNFLVGPIHILNSILFF